MSTIEIRPASPDDCELILRFITELAIYEEAEDAVVATEDDIRNTLFASDSATSAVICEIDQQAVGFAVFFFNYSTWLGKPGLHLEDLFVEPDHRGNGIGKALLIHLAQKAVQQNCARFEWQCLDWNQPSIDFYEKLGAKAMREWIPFRAEGNALKALAQLETI